MVAWMQAGLEALASYRYAASSKKPVFVLELSAFPRAPHRFGVIDCNAVVTAIPTIQARGTEAYGRPV